MTASVNDVAGICRTYDGYSSISNGATDIERLKDMGHRLQTKVIGQDKAVEAVAKLSVVTVLVLMKVTVQSVASFVGPNWCW